MTEHIGHVSEILYLYDQLKKHPYGARAIIADRVSKLGKCWLTGDVSGSDLVRELISFSEEYLLDVIRVTKAVYAIPTNRIESLNDSDSDSIEKFG